MTDRITTTCQHSHTVTLRLDEGEWKPDPPDWFKCYDRAQLTSGDDHAVEGHIPTWGWEEAEAPAAIRAELEAALAAAEASCGGCGCADRLRAEARVAGKNHPIAQGALEFAADFLDAAPGDQPPTTCHCGQPFAYGYDGDPTHHRGMCARCDAVRCDAYPGACEDAAQDARGSDLSAEQGEEEQ